MAAAGTCTPYPNTLLQGDQVASTDEDSEAICCKRCNSNPQCDVWSYCNTDVSKK